MHDGPAGGIPPGRVGRILGVEGAHAGCTNVRRTIEVRIAGGAWTVDVERNADPQCVPGSYAGT
jgi:hypothetical protein